MKNPDPIPTIHMKHVVLSLLLLFIVTPDLQALQNLPDLYIDGFSRPFREAEVAAASSGILHARVVSEGQAVQAGDTLVEIDDTVHQTLVAIAKAAMESSGELKAALAEQKLRQRRLVTIRDLAQRGHATPDELLRAETEWDLAQAKVYTAQEKELLRELEYKKLIAQLATYSVKAPFPGIVTEFSKTPGEYVGPIDPVVCTIVDLHTLSVDFLVPRSRREQIELGKKMQVRFEETEQEVEGTVYYVSPFPDGETNTYTVKIQVDNPHGTLSAGERCSLITNREAQPPRLSAAVAP
jgi:RND family efflux transporter MFP subunit